MSVRESEAFTFKEWLVTGEGQSHQTKTEMIQSTPPEVYAGTDMPLRVRVSCASGCDLRGKRVRIKAPDSVVATDVVLDNFEEQVNETDEFNIKAPLELGRYTWIAVFPACPAQEEEGALHEESSTPFSFTVNQHATSIAVWDVPSPVAVNANFTIKAGVKCSAACKLAGTQIEVYDEKEEKVAGGTLGETPVQQTSALYWAEVELKAPDAERHYAWVVRFADPGLDLWHEQTSYTFGFTTARPPEHLVTVEAIEKDTQTPLKNARVTLQASGAPYTKLTDGAGVARINVPKGNYILYVMKPTYEDFQTTAHVVTDVALKAELSVAPHTPFGH